MDEKIKNRLRKQQRGCIDHLPSAGYPYVNREVLPPDFLFRPRNLLCPGFFQPGV